jgi:hypothetical protein
MTGATETPKRDVVHYLMRAELTSCTCLTKTDAPQYHAEDCRYRAIREARDEIVRLREMVVDCRDKVLVKVAEQPSDIGRATKALVSAMFSLLPSNRK